MLGPWWGQGRDEDAVTVYQGIKAQNPETTFTEACEMAHTEPPDNTPADECGSDAELRRRGGGRRGRPTRSCSRSASRAR